MFVKPARLIPVVALLTAVGVMGVPTAAADSPSIPPPEDLRATEVYADAIYLEWEPGSTDPDLAYRVHNLTLGWSLDTTATTFRWAIGLKSDQTHSFAVTHVDADGKESALSNRVTVTPHVTPATDVQATLDGDTITVTWNRPDGLDPDGYGAIYYFLHLNGEDERLFRAGKSRESIQISFPLVDPGRTHVYTVQTAGIPGGHQESEPALLTVPPSADTTVPTAPSWRAFCTSADPYNIQWEMLAESTDDTTPSAEIRYEARDNYGADGHYVTVNDFPRSGNHLEDFTAGGIGLRAVDEAGNRSVLAQPVWDC